MMTRPTLALLGLLLLWQAPARADVTAGKYTRVYKGREGLKVTVVHLSPATERTALIKFTGTEHRLDGHVLLYRIDGRDSRRSYSTFFKGRRWTPLRTGEGWGREALRFSLGGRSSETLRYHEKESRRINPRSVVEEYRRQVRAGKIAEIQGLSRKARRKLVKRELRAHAGYHRSDCTFAPKVEVDWATVKDEQRYFTDVTGACVRAIDAMARLCSDWSSSDVKARVRTIRCRFGKKLAVNLARKRLVVTMPIGVQGLADKVQAVIKR